MDAPDSANIARSVLGAATLVGPGTEVIGAVVGARTRIQGSCVVCPGVLIGHDCFIGHGVVFANGDPAARARTCIGNRVCIGRGAVIMPVTVCDDAVIGAGAVVTRDITAPGIYAGNPARRLSGLAHRRPVH